MRIWLVTGGAGYIGSNVINQMIGAGFDVRSLDQKTLPQNFRMAQKFEHVVGGYGDRDVLSKALDTVVGILHLGALKNPVDSITQKDLYHQNNVVDSQTLLSQAKEVGVANFVFASSAAVYGSLKKKRVSEADQPQPINPYGQFKLDFEGDLAAAGESNFATTSLRLFNVAGVGSSGVFDASAFSILPRVKTTLEEDQIFTIYGDKYETIDGTAVRDYVHVSDVADAFVKAAQALSAKTRVSQTINIATGSGISVREVVETMAKVSGKDARTTVEPNRPGDIDVSIGENARAIAELGWRPRYGLEEIATSLWGR